MATLEHLPLIAASPGTFRRLQVHRYGRPGARPKAYLQGALHAGETPGCFVLHHLRALLDDAERAGRIIGEVVVVPVANPIGLGQVVAGVHIGRFDLAGRGNFNRDVPDVSDALARQAEPDLGPDPDANVAVLRRHWAALLAEITPTTEVDSLRLALSRLAVDADLVLDNHSDSDALPHLYLSTGSWPDARDLSAAMGSYATLLAEESGGNPFDEAFSAPWLKLRRRFEGRFPIPVGCLSATLEWRGQHDVSDAMAAADAEGLMAFLVHRGVVAGTAALPAPRCDATPLDAVDVLKSPGAGILAWARPVGAEIAAGEVVAELVDPLAEDPRAGRTPIVSQTTGVLFARPLLKLARPGQSIGKIAGTAPLATRTGKLSSD